MEKMMIRLGGFGWEAHIGASCWKKQQQQQQQVESLFARAAHVLIVLITLVAVWPSVAQESWHESHLANIRLQKFSASFSMSCGQLAKPGAVILLQKEIET